MMLRDDLHEDPDRLPDGVPHAVVAMTAFYSVVFAIALMVMLVGDWLVPAALVAFAIPMVVSRLARKAERERDRVHPSR